MVAIGSPREFGTLDPVRTNDPSDARRDPGATDRTVLLVGGVPGAGKSTAIDAVTLARTDVDVIDSDTVRRWLTARLPEGLPYRRFRWLVHTATVVWMIGALLRGPRPDRRLLVHDPSTRPRRRRLFAGLARFRGWEPDLLIIDVSRDDAQRGQRQRQRVVRPAAFDRHWARWLELRRDLLEAPRELDGGRWRAVTVVDRAGAVAALHERISPAGPAAWSLMPARDGCATDRTDVSM